MRTAILGFTFGMGMFSAGVTWIYVSLHDFGAMSMPAAVLALIVLCAYLALFPALTGWILTKLRISAPIVWSSAAGALWGLSDWLRSFLFTGFPWLTLGYSQAPAGPLGGFAPVMGVYGVSLVLVLSAALICLLFEKRFREWRYLLPLLAIWIIGFGLQQIRWTEPQGEPVTVSLLQGNIAQDLKWREDQLVTSMDTYARLTLESSSRLIITPEISVPLYRDEVPSSYLAQLATHAKRNNGDILVGMSAFINQKPAFQTLEIGNTYLVPAMRGTGFNRRLKRLMIDHAFACGYRRIEFRIDDRNARSKAAVAKLGAHFEGIIRAERITWNGHVRDTALFSILAGEWAK